jgi:curved DNA-binding protein
MNVARLSADIRLGRKGALVPRRQQVLVDYYEVLQISPNADQETVHRIYRIQAQRFHPDNLETGNAETFRLVSDAYQVLSNPESRATYDAEHRDAHRRAGLDGFAPPASAPALKDEAQKREEIILMLYRRRLARPDQPSLSLRELETLLATPKDHLEFSLWYLKETGYLTRNDSARHTITIKGVELAESMNRSPNTSGEKPQNNTESSPRDNPGEPARLDSGAKS